MAISSALLLAACGGGGGGGGGSSNNDSAKTGQLIDSAVAGVAYQTPSYSGKTNANGEYHFIDGEAVTFAIGSISFGPLPAKAVLTPLDLAGSTDITNRKVINIARLLQTLDDDQNPANGIVIPASANPAGLNFDQDVADFESEVSTLLSLTLVDESAAMAHLQAELEELNAGTGELDSEPASVPAAFVGSHTFKYEEIVPGSGIADGALSTFEIQAGNKLKLPNGTVLSNPVYLNGNQAEAIWLDAATGLSYALSNTLTASLNELNIAKGLFGSPGFQFYGQYSPFVETEGQVPAALKAMDGSYTTKVNYSKAGNRNGWAVGDELTLTINGATGVIDVGGVYSIDPTDPSFSWTDNTSKHPTFNPAYEVLYNGIDKLIIYQHPGEPINSWRLTQDASASDGVSVWAHITPIIESHQSYLDELAMQLPATLTLVEQGGSGSIFKGSLCTDYPFDMDNNGVNGIPRLLYNLSQYNIRSVDYSPSSAAYEENGTEQRLYWAGFMLGVDGTTLTATEVQLGNELEVVLTNDPAKIATAGCVSSD
ncbi:MAG: hypothetical protein CL537_06190 [Alcanivoracaceae bacterium]|nr:hypothetical protein [Alcanivoracaceae bacterium]MCG8438839.1 hypothetical protein [Pseudomonadales bacterium]